MNLRSIVVQRLTFMASHYEQIGGTEQSNTLRAAIAMINADDVPGSTSPTPLQLKCKQLEASLRLLSSDLLALTEESTGVAGWHLNGDIAKWDEFEGMMNIARGAL